MAVKSRLRTMVKTELDRVRGIKALTNVFSDTFEDIVGVVEEDIDDALSLIPSPSDIQFTDIESYKACPLFVLTSVLDAGEFEELDPQVQLDMVKSMQADDIVRIRIDYEKKLAESNNAAQIRLIRKYADESRRIAFDPTSFFKAVLISVYVFVLSPTEYNAGPYGAFTTEIEGFSLNGALPTTVGPKLAAVVNKLTQAETKFAALRKTLK